jgi:ribonuclease HI
MTYYVVHKGRKPGIYNNWKDCKKQVDGFESPIFKKFDNQKEAQNFLENGFPNKKNYVSKKTNIDKKNLQILSDELENQENKVFVYTDGSCIKFKNGLSKAGYGIYIPSKNIRVGEPLLNQKQTNNRAELTAILKVFLYITEEEKKKKIIIITDSQYSIYIFKDTGLNYEKDNFMKDGKEVLNKDLIIEALKIKRTYNVVLLKVRAHTTKEDIHSKNNEIVDKLAKDGAYKNTHNNNSSNIFKKRIENYQSEDYYDNLEDYATLPTNIYTGMNNDNNNYKDNNTNHKKQNINFQVTDNIKKNITMNELFGYEESNETITKIKKKNSSTLNKWFIKND